MDNVETKAAMSVVIPTWNRRDLALSCLESLAAQSQAAAEIVVVDDGSEDDTQGAVRAAFPEVRVVALAENRGFACAANAGIRAATQPWILLLNNDMTLEPDFLARMWEAAQGGDAMIAPLVLWREEPGVVYGAGDGIARNGRPFSHGFRAPREAFQPPETIFGVSAGAGLYSRRLFDCIGLLDETFQAYFEDSDLCFRARLAGFTARCVPEAVAYHIGSASIEGRRWWRSAQCCKNHALLLIKNMPAPLLLRYLPAIAAERLHQARCAFSAARTEFGALGAAGVLFGVWRGFMRALPSALRARRRIQRSRQIPLNALAALLEEHAP